MGKKSTGTREEDAKNTTGNLSFDNQRMRDMGSRYTPSGSETVYARDVDVLWRLYNPLRRSIYKKVASKLNNESDKEDLISYINEHFVRLVKEYDVSSEVDFPGYVKTLLTFRTTSSFISGIAKVYNKEESIGIQDELDAQMHDENGIDIDEEDVMSYYDEFLQYVMANYSFTDMELSIMEHILVDDRSLAIAREIREEYGITQKEALVNIDDLRNRLKEYVQEFANI